MRDFLLHRGTIPHSAGVTFSQFTGRADFMRSTSAFRAICIMFHTELTYLSISLPQFLHFKVLSDREIFCLYLQKEQVWLVISHLSTKITEIKSRKSFQPCSYSSYHCVLYLPPKKPLFPKLFLKNRKYLNGV